MVTRVRRVFPLAGVVLACAVLVASCQKVPLLAPSGSTISLLAGTNILPLNGATDVTAQVIEPSGTPPQSGTLVTFTTTLGSIQPSEATTDLGGRARVRFVAGGTSGTATITAISGGVSAGDKGSIKIAVGAAAVGGITATASPPTVSSSGGSSTITAKILDMGGNPLASVPVTFATDAGSLSASVVNTDASGSASTVLFTNKTAKVTATAGLPGTSTSGTTTTTTPASTATVTVTVNSTGAITAGAATPNPATVGQVVSVPLTYPATGTTGASPVTSVRVDWGDGTVQPFSGQPPVVTHPYRSEGAFVIVITGSDTFGDTSSAFSSVTVTARPKPTVDISPGTPCCEAGKTSTFTITATAATGSGATISSIDIDWGDGTSDHLPGNAKSASHVYDITKKGSKAVVTATATDSNGQQGSGSVLIVVQ